MSGSLKLRTLAQFRAVVSSGTGVVITDVAGRPVFHLDPAGCAHVQEDHFGTKVIENRERNGSYFALPSLTEARRRWPQIRSCRSSACSAAAEAMEQPGSEALEEVLREATGVSVVKARRRDPRGAEVMPAEWKATQRLALGLSADRLVLRTWPAELKHQARAFYRSDRPARLLELAADGWEAIPMPHLAFNGSQPQDRFYFSCPLDLGRYIAFWSQPQNLARAGGHPLESVEPELWPWLCENELADPNAADAGQELERFIARLRLRRSQAHLRPGIQVSHTLNSSLSEEPAVLTAEARAAVQALAAVV
jgi:hypothetical protein